MDALEIDQPFVDRLNVALENKWADITRTYGCVEKFWVAHIVLDRTYSVRPGQCMALVDGVLKVVKK